jgi:hypothetical protein
MAGAEELGFCGSTGLQAGEIAAKKKRALAPAQFANSRINIGYS